MRAEDLDAVSGQLARHYERAGMIEQALTHYQRAAPPLPRVYANEYAVSLLTHSLKLIGQLPASSARNSSLNAQVMPLQ